MSLEVRNEIEKQLLARLRINGLMPSGTRQRRLETEEFVWLVYLDRPPYGARAVPEIGLWIRHQSETEPTRANNCPIIIYPELFLEGDERGAFTEALDGDIQLSHEVRAQAVEGAADAIVSLIQSIPDLRALKMLYEDGRLRGAAVRADQRRFLEGVT